MSTHMVAKHALREKSGDIIFGIAARAKERAEKIGSENIINSTIGSLLDDNGKLITLDTVYNSYKKLPNEKIADYAPPEGIHEFLEAAKKACFMGHEPKCHIRAVATPGGTGGIRHAVYNFTNEGDKILTANWYWAPYKTIATEYERGFDTFNLFNDKKEFDFESYKAKFDELLDAQGRLLIILNTPAHNPTGYTISDEEWDKIIALASDRVADGSKKVIFLCDIAYIDFSRDCCRNFMEKFGGLSENILALFSFSTSKSFTMYGLRNGALLMCSSDEEIAEECYYSCSFSNRASWSNGSRGAMQVVVDIFSDDKLLAEFEKERDGFRKLLADRGAAFWKSAKENNLPVTNYKDGFFVSVECKDPKALCERLIEDNLFTVPLQNGIRLALCAISEEKCAVAPKLIKKALEELE